MRYITKEIKSKFSMKINQNKNKNKKDTFFQIVWKCSVIAPEKTSCHSPTQRVEETNTGSTDSRVGGREMEIKGQEIARCDRPDVSSSETQTWPLSCCGNAGTIASISCSH